MNWMTRSIGSFGRALSWVIVHLPRPLRDALGASLGLLWYDVFRIRRDVVFKNLTIAFPDMPDEKKVRLGRRALMNFGKNFVEYSYLPHFGKLSLEDHFVAEGTELLDQALSEGKGIVLITCHLGHGDLACAALSKMGYPIHMVSKLFSIRWLNGLWFGMREKVGTAFIPPRNSSFALLKALKSNGIVVVPLDQFTGPPIGVLTKFFGRETGTAAGPALMAERAKAPVVLGCTWRLPDGRHQIYFNQRIDVHLGEDHDREIVRYTQKFNDALEDFVRKHPDQWMWIHKRWKTFEVT